jgi:hypothetical protein
LDFFFGGFLASRFGAFLFPMPTASHRIEVDARGQQRKLHLDPPFFFKSRICNLDARRRERSCFKGCLSRIRVAVSGSGWSTPSEAAEKVGSAGVLKGRTFRCAVKLFIFVITSGLQPARDLLFRLFQQPVQACIPSCKKGEALAEVATQSLLPASGSAFPASSAACEAGTPSKLPINCGEPMHPQIMAFPAWREC